MQQGKLNPVQAQEQLVQELAADGIVLEQKKRDALGVLLSFAAGLSIALAVTQLGDAVPAAPTDSLQPAARSTPPPGSGARSWASFFGALSASAAAAFCVGYWWREPAPAPLAAGERPAPPAGATIAAAATCPPVATCTPCEPAKSPDCPCSREQCGRKAAPSPALDEQRSSLQACQQQLTTATRALNACNQGKQPSRSTSTTITRATPMLAVGGSASTPILR